jgi:hypothetical protein
MTSLSREPTVNSFDARTDTDGAELERTIAAYSAAARNVSSLEEIDGAARALKESLSPESVQKILEHYRSGAGIPRSVLDDAARGAMGASPEATRSREEATRAREKNITAERLKAQEQLMARPRVVDANAVDAKHAYAHYYALVSLGALWYSGYLSTVLSVLGWTEVRSAIDEIAVWQPAQRIGKAPKREAVIKQIVGALKQRAGVSFGAVSNQVHENVIKHQVDIADGKKPITHADNAEGFTPAFLAAYIKQRAKWAKEHYAGKMKAEHSDVVQFRLIVSAVASVIRVLYFHVISTFRAFRNVNDGSALMTTIFECLAMHTTVFQNGSGGVFQRLHGHMNTISTKSMSVADGTGATIDDTNMRDLVARLATAEKDGVFAKLVASTLERSKANPTKLPILFSALVPKYLSLTPDYSMASAKDRISTLQRIHLELNNVGPMAKNATFTSLGIHGNDELIPKLEELVDELVAASEIASYEIPDLAPIFERASASVSLATRAVYKESENHLKALMSEVIRKLGVDTRTSRVDESLFHLACLALARDTTSDAWKDAAERTEDAHSLRRSILSSFLESTKRKNPTSTTKLLVMARQLMHMRVDFNTDRNTAYDIVGKSQKTLADPSTFSQLQARAPGYFGVQAISDWQMLTLATDPEPQYHAYARFPSSLVTQFDVATKKKYDELVAERATLLRKGRRDNANGVTQKIARLLSEHPPRAQLTIDHLRNAKGPKTNKERDDEINELEIKHGEYKSLVGVGFAEARAAAAENRDQVYGVMFKHEFIHGSHAWHLFVHINIESTFLIFGKLRDLIQQAYVITANVDKVVFGLDEWPEKTIRNDILPKRMRINLEQLETLDNHDFNENGTLFVHRWPEMELIPAPFGIASPMFQEPPKIPAAAAASTLTLETSEDLGRKRPAAAAASTLTLETSDKLGWLKRPAAAALSPSRPSAAAAPAPQGNPAPGIGDMAGAGAAGSAVPAAADGAAALNRVPSRTALAGVAEAAVARSVSEAARAASGAGAATPVMRPGLDSGAGAAMPLVQSGSGSGAAALHPAVTRARAASARSMPPADIPQARPRAASAGMLPAALGSFKNALPQLLPRRKSDSAAGAGGAQQQPERSNSADFGPPED